MPKPKFSFEGKKKQVITVVVVVLLLIAAGGAGVWLSWLQHAHSNTGNNSGANTPQNTLPQSVQDAQNLAATGNYDQSNKQIAASIAATSSSDEKYELYLQQGINDENQSQWDNAFSAYNSAAAIKKTSTVYISLGRVSEEKGDKSSALNYYRLALPLLNPKDPVYNFDKRDLENKIKAVGG